MRPQAPTIVATYLVLALNAAYVKSHFGAIIYNCNNNCYLINAHWILAHMQNTQIMIVQIYNLRIRMKVKKCAIVCVNVFFFHFVKQNTILQMIWVCVSLHYSDTWYFIQSE